MTDEEDQPAAVEAPITLESVAPEVLGIDPNNPVAPELMSWCAAALRAIAPNPDGVRLVVTGDFVGSVRSRSVTQHQQENYHTARNGGEVAAKTMRRPDGTYDVLVPAWWFVHVLDDMEDADPEDRRLIARRTTAHEAFHVAMGQSGESATDFSSEPFVRQNFLNVADAVMEEYRAEVSLSPTLRDAPQTRWEPIDVITHLRAALRRIAAVEYQQHLDVERLYYEIGTECLHAWQLLAYVVARQTMEDGSVEPLPDDVLADELWSWMVAPHWQRFINCLSQFPPGSERTPRDQLEPGVGELADELPLWLENLGFQWTQAGAGSRFAIVHWRFVE